jgi:transcriptional regulator with XRE-family HTH domain
MKTRATPRPKGPEFAELWRRLIKQACRNLGLTQEALAERYGRSIASFRAPFNRRNAVSWEYLSWIMHDAQPDAALHTEAAMAWLNERREGDALFDAAFRSLMEIAPDLDESLDRFLHLYEARLRLDGKLSPHPMKRRGD